MDRVFTKKEPEKKLLKPLKKTGGRGAIGKITVWHRGGGVKRLYRIIEFSQKKIDMPAKVVATEYDPNRTAYLALIEYEDKEKKYILAPDGMKIGDNIIFSETAPLALGNRLKLKNISIGMEIYNIELEPGRGGKIVRSAGTAAIVMAQEENYTQLKMPSGEIRRINKDCFASIGRVSNPEHRFKKLKKAGQVRKKGRRPTVRGTVMNPPDHPHGGGEGRAPIGLKNPKTPWGKPALGVKTRKKRWTDKLIIKRRGKK